MEKTLVQQINFYIMRKKWLDIRKRSKTGNLADTIHDNLNMSRTRYTRALDGDTIRISKEELVNLQSYTGVSCEIFTGETQFQINEVTQEHWKEFFRLRDKNTKSEEYKQLKNEIDEKIKKQSTNDSSNFHFYTFCHFAAGRKVQDSKSETRIKNIMKELQAIKFTDFEEVHLETIGRYKKILDEQFKMIITFYNYKNYQKRVSKKNDK